MMTETEFDQEKARLVALYGNAPKDAMYKRNNAFALFYATSGWNQTRLAKQEGIHQTRISQLLIFGEFQIYFKTKCLKDFDDKEGLFRAHWRRTEETASRHARFDAVIDVLDAAQQAPSLPVKRGSKRLATKILELFADSRWHNLSVIYTRIEDIPKNIDTVLDAMRLRGAFHTFCERRRGSKDEGGWQYRFTKHHGQHVNYGVLMTELEPIIQRFKEEGQKNMATMSPATVTVITHDLIKTLEKLAQ